MPRLQRLLLLLALTTVVALAQQYVYNPITRVLDRTAPGNVHITGSGVPANPCPSAGTFFISTSNIAYFCGTAGGNWNQLGSGTTSTGNPAYTTNVVAQTTLTVPAATHGQGLFPLSFCFSGTAPGPYTKVNCGDTFDSAGADTFTWTPAFTGLVAIVGSTGGGGSSSLTIGTTTISGGTTNQLLFDNAGVAGEVTKCNSGVYSTNGSGVPACSSTLPSGLTIPLADLPAPSLVRTCEITFGDPGSTSPVLANDNDAPVVCGNTTGSTLTITAVQCYADAGSPTMTPIITGGSGTSILTGALTCGTGSFASGTLNGTPTQSNNGTIDANITAAGGTAKYIVLRITRTL